MSDADGASSEYALGRGYAASARYKKIVVY